MEAERVATETRAEPERAPPAATGTAEHALAQTTLGSDARGVMRTHQVPLAEAARSGRENGLQRVPLMIANPGGRLSPELGPPGAVGESYEDFYAREFRRSPHPAAP